MSVPPILSKYNKWAQLLLFTQSIYCGYYYRPDGTLMCAECCLFGFTEVKIMNCRLYLPQAAVLLAGMALWLGSAAAAPLPLLVSAPAGASLAAIVRPLADETDPAELASNLRRQTVNYSANAAPGTVIIDTEQTYLYFVLGDGKAIRYGIGVGRQGFT
ncbi:MAG: hypothetical protein WBD48_04495, partial [Pseudolabrys sp.]